MLKLVSPSTAKFMSWITEWGISKRNSILNKDVNKQVEKIKMVVSGSWIWGSGGVGARHSEVSLFYW